MIANRISGLAVALFGLVLITWIIPANTETVERGWMRPQTIPDTCAVLLIALGVIHAVFPTGKVIMRPKETLRAIGYAIVALLALWAMDRFGFLIAAPVFALVIMLLVGEKRPVWLAAGAVALPITIWVTVVVLLGRTLP